MLPGKRTFIVVLCLLVFASIFTAKYLNDASLFFSQSGAIVHKDQKMSVDVERDQSASSAINVGLERHVSSVPDWISAATQSHSGSFSVVTQQRKSISAPVPFGSRSISASGTAAAKRLASGSHAPQRIILDPQWNLPPVGVDRLNSATDVPLVPFVRATTVDPGAIMVLAPQVATGFVLPQGTFHVTALGPCEVSIRSQVGDGTLINGEPMIPLMPYIIHGEAVLTNSVEVGVHIRPVGVTATASPSSG